jgi:hypothetical protein
MMNSVFDDFKNEWQQPNTGLAQLIIIHIAVFVLLVLLAVISTV